MVVYTSRVHGYTSRVQSPQMICMCFSVCTRSCARVYVFSCVRAVLCSNSVLFLRIYNIIHNIYIYVFACINITAQFTHPPPHPLINKVYSPYLYIIYYTHTYILYIYNIYAQWYMFVYILYIVIIFYSRLVTQLVPLSSSGRRGEGCACAWEREPHNIIAVISLSESARRAGGSGCVLALRRGGSVKL